MFLTEINFILKKKNHTMYWYKYICSYVGNDKLPHI